MGEEERRRGGEEGRSASVHIDLIESRTAGSAPTVTEAESCLDGPTQKP
jgi:hypothetical protein